MFNSAIFAHVILISLLFFDVIISDNKLSRLLKNNAEVHYHLHYNYHKKMFGHLIISDTVRKRDRQPNNFFNGSNKLFNLFLIENELQSIFIYPGTNWCGTGNRASYYDDLGYHSAEDSCCREHDHCPATIAPYKCTNGLCNIFSYTLLHCDCDAKFYRCLQNLNTNVANSIGILYFNIIQIMCFKEAKLCPLNGYIQTNKKPYLSYELQFNKKYFP